MWGRGDTITGGYGQLDEIVSAAKGYRKLDALLSIISLGTGENVRKRMETMGSILYSERYYAMDVGRETGWGEKLMDFIMFEHAALGLKHSTTNGMICAIRNFMLRMAVRILLQMEFDTNCYSKRCRRKCPVYRSCRVM